MKVLGICDYNAYGLALLLSYRFGSSSSANTVEARGLYAPTMKWLGLRRAHLNAILQANCPQQIASDLQSNVQSHGQMQVLTLTDRKKISDMLRSATIQVSRTLCCEPESQDHFVLTKAVEL
jgi:hypothetical protein